MRIITKEGIWLVKAGEVFNFKGFNCLITQTRKRNNAFHDTIKINEKYHELKREDWIKKFTE